MIRFNWTQLEMEGLGGCHSNVEMCLCGETPFPFPLPFLSWSICVSRSFLVLHVFATFFSICFSYFVTSDIPNPNEIHPLLGWWSSLYELSEFLFALLTQRSNEHVCLCSGRLLANLKRAQNIIINNEVI